MKNRPFPLLIAAALALVFTAVPATAQDDSEEMMTWEKLMARQKWVVGPGTGDLGHAEFDVPEGYQLTDGKGTREILAAMGNIVGDSEVGLLMPLNTNSTWLVVFEFDDSGYVKDDDKD